MPVPGTGDPVRSATGAVSHDHNESALRHTGCEGSFESGSPGSEVGKACGIYFSFVLKYRAFDWA